MNGKEYLEARGYKVHRPGFLHKLALALFEKYFEDNYIHVYSYPPLFERHQITYEVEGYIEVGDLAVKVLVYTIFDDTIEEQFPLAEALLFEWFEKHKS